MKAMTYLLLCLSLSSGGPGGSGVALLWMLWSPFRALLGDEFDLVGFDPRGVYSLIHKTKLGSADT